MTQNPLYQSLTTLTPHELHLKSCYEKGSLPSFPSDVPFLLTEEMFFPSNSRQNITVLKHQCYSPIQTHSHDFFEVIYVLKGQSQHEIGIRHSQLNTGDLCILPPGSAHNIHVYDDSAILDILIRRSAFEKVFSSLMDSDNILTSFFTGAIYAAGANDYIIFHTGQDQALQSLILDMYQECCSQEKYYEMLLDTQLAMLFARLLRSYESSCELPPFQSRSESQIFGMIQYMNRNYQKISLKDLAEKFHYTPTYTSKRIHEATGRTFSALLAQIRMEHAARLLKSTTLTVGEIGLQTGYTTPEHFIRTFKKHFHITPNEYRKSFSISY
ncbi:MAG: AraC family transcriptional regulator [Lachnospiraceae bacterium]|nr:AraC family transcriptional regulator [Lachnospiraceae bacterium]MCI9151164.1 AraC family transcriptional regulator [Lachnospiraceae bacterium]